MNIHSAIKCEVDISIGYFFIVKKRPQCLVSKTHMNNTKSNKVWTK